MKILAYTTRSMGGFFGNNVITHFDFLREYSNDIDLLTSLKGTKDADHLIKLGFGNINLIKDYAELYHSKYAKWEDWMKIYDDLDVSRFKDYDLLVMVGNICSPTQGVTCASERHKGKFPMSTGTSWISSAMPTLLLLVLLKAHNTYGIPLHEEALDPDELSYMYFDKRITPDPENSFAYHGYDKPSHTLHGLDNYIWHFKNKNITNIEKEVDFVFGYTYKKNIRTSYIEDLEVFISTIQDKEIYKKELGNKKAENTILSREEYMKRIRVGRFTYILPSYYNEFFSGYRLIESLAYDCLPIIQKDCNISDVQKYFDFDFSRLILTELPTKEERIELLKELKSKVFDRELNLLIDVEIPVKEDDFDEW